MRTIGTLLVGTVLAGCSHMSGPSSLPSAALPSMSTDAVRPNAVSFKLLHSFKGGKDGSNPFAGLIDVDGTLYGTTLEGGPDNVGTVFTISPSGTEKVLYTFKTTGGDGQLPVGNLTDVKGTLYGATESGGLYNGYGYGTVFTITTKGSEKVIGDMDYHDGQHPWAGLTLVRGVLFDVANVGGNGSGTIFKSTTGGTIATVHTFDYSDGNGPQAQLTAVKGTLYGTTAFGGANGAGTVFSVKPGGAFKVLHSFSGTDGASPLGPTCKRQWNTLWHGGGRRRLALWRHL